MCNVLICGNGKGSWSMRGVQLGTALGARVWQRIGSAAIDPADLAWAQVAVLVKKAALPCAAQLRAARIPIVWDVLDFWQQPGENALRPAEARATLQRLRDYVQPDLVIGATVAMTEACAAWGAATYVPHHSWAGLAPAPARPAVQVVAYQGNPAYLGRWHLAVQRECLRRGWRFTVNADDLRPADLVVAVRDTAWDGWMCREWKSGVKLVNAIAAGRPVITQRTAAAREIGPCGSLVDDPADLSDAFDSWADEPARALVVDASIGLAPPYRLDAVATGYRAALESVTRV